MDVHPLEQWRLEEQSRRGKPFRRYQLAEQLGCSASRLTQIIRDREPPSLALAARMKQRTGISVDELLAAAKCGLPQVEAVE
jgi:transcriptional regulator with XRE-family HTH domain